MARRFNVWFGDQHWRWAWRLGTKLFVLLLVLGAASALFILLRDTLSLERIVQREAQLREQVALHPMRAIAIGFVLYVAVTGHSLPGAGILSLLYGWLFGFWRAVVLLSFASTAGAGIAFTLSRYLLGDFVQRRYAERLRSFNDWLEREGPFYLFWLRLIPTVPFFVINLVMGLTRMRLRTFLWVSQVGMFPGTCLFAYAGSRLPTLEQIVARGPAEVLTVEVMVAFALLGAVPLALRWIARRATTRRSP